MRKNIYDDAGALLGRIRAYREIRNIGFISWVAFKYHKKRQNRGLYASGELKALSSRTLSHPVYFRPGTSDLLAFRQVFAEREYGCLDDCGDPRLIIDCGANVGYTSAYFLSRFPLARVIAVEPDGDNFELLKRNLEPYGARATLVRAGIWPERTGLVVTEESSVKGQEWGRKIRPVREGEAACIDAVDIISLLRLSGETGISILKIDIEGAEEALFSANRIPWIHAVENLVIELHGKRCESTFFRAIAEIPFTVSRSGELTVCRRNKG